MSEAVLDFTRGFWRTNRIIIPVLMAALFVGALTARSELLSVVIALGIGGWLLVLRYGSRVFWAYLLFLLAGYMLGGRGFAYVGVYPAYVGEVGIAAGVLTLVMAAFTTRVKVSLQFQRWLLVPLGLIIIWNAMQSIPYLRTYGLDTLRDSMMYLYSLYAIFIALLIPKAWIERLFTVWTRIMPLFLLWVPVAYIFMTQVRFPITFPGAPVPLVSVKFGDIGVHLAGAGALLLLQMGSRRGSWSSLIYWGSWFLWVAGWMMFGSTNRAGLVSALWGVAIVVLLWPRSNWHRPVAIGVVMLWLVLFAGSYDELSLSVGDREITPETIALNLSSVFGQSDVSRLENTKEWRLNWWNDIIDYTFYGPFFWTGKGYGINLATSDGYSVGPVEGELRSPHNSHFNFLARAGVPGFALWVVFLAAFEGFLLWVIFTQRRKSPELARRATWLFAYTTAFLINGSFDLVMESPFAAIWFWSLVGFSLVYFTDLPQTAPVPLSQRVGGQAPHPQQLSLNRQALVSGSTAPYREEKRGT